MQKRKFPKSRKLIMLMGDLVIVTFSYIAATFCMLHSLSNKMNVYIYSEMFICFVGSMLVFYHIAELYTISRKRFADLLIDIFFACVGVLIVSMVYNHFVLNDVYARKFILLSVIAFSFLMVFWRYFMWRIERKLHSTSKSVLILGNEEECARIYNKMANRPQLNLRLKYVCSNIKNIDWKNIVDRIDTIVICESIHHREKMLIMNYCYQHNKELLLSPNYYELFCSEAILTQLDDLPVLVPQALQPSIENKILKRIEDVSISVIVFLATLPVMLMCWMMVFLWEGRPVLCRQKRVGRFGKDFLIVKFRTKVDGSNKLTDTGRFLEWSHLNALPEFWNVLRGDMSVVGPNADLPDVARNNSETIQEYIYKMNVKPGVTGLAQVYGNECTDASDKLFYDLKYIQQASLHEDLVILIQTIRTLFTPNRLQCCREKKGKFDFDEYDVLLKANQKKDLPQTPFSVLMSVYKKEKPEYFQMAVASVMEQTYKPSEILIVQDGPLTEELYAVCNKMKREYKELVRFVQLEKNVGLGLALQHGVKECKYDLIARMDTDDISKKDRFELQVRQFEKHVDLAICGGYIEEFYDRPNRIQTVRRVPLTESDIYEYTKLRSPFNHVTVMFKRQAILAVGNYQPFLLLEDYYLWYRLVSKKYHTKNLPIVLVSVRADEGMIARRGGLSYFIREAKLYRKFYENEYISLAELIFALCSRFMGRVCPPGVRSFLYQTFLR